MAMATCAMAKKAPIEITNYKNGETIRYPLVLLRGELGDATADKVTVVNTSSKRETRTMEGQAHNGLFKAFAELVPGKNKLTIKGGKDKSSFVLNYKPQTNPYKVRAIHFTDNTGDPTFENQFKDDQDYRAKWDAALKLMQTFTAEEMHRLGYGRKTFNLELDEDGKVIVHIVKDKRNFEELQKLSGGAAYGASASAIAEQLPNHLYKNLVCVAFSRRNREKGYATAYAALGGGNTALMGGACFYTWPTGVKNIHKTFMSDVQIDTRNFHADDVGRYAVWATASTTIGSGLHELGHAFTLPHTRTHGNGIMLRGADTLNRYVAFLDPPSTRHKDYRPFKKGQEPYWADVSAAALAPSRWFALDKRTYTEKNTIDFAVDPATNELVIHSDDGLAFVCVELPGQAEYYDKRANLKDLPKELRLPLAPIAKRFKTDNLTIRAEDGMGHYRHTSLAGILNLEENLATGKPVTASGVPNENQPAKYAVDGNLGTYWDANPYPQWLQVDLGKAVTLDEIHLYGYTDGRRFYQYKIDCSLDGKNWSTVVDASGSTTVATAEGYRHTFKPQRTRYVRATMLKNSANPGVHIRELRVFEPGAPRVRWAYAGARKLFEDAAGN
jgi:hypothetical protein